MFADILEFHGRHVTHTQAPSWTLFNGHKWQLTANKYPFWNEKSPIPKWGCVSEQYNQLRRAQYYLDASMFLRRCSYPSSGIHRWSSPRPTKLSLLASGPRVPCLRRGLVGLTRRNVLGISLCLSHRVSNPRKIFGRQLNICLHGKNLLRAQNDSHQSGRKKSMVVAVELEN